MTNNTPPPPTRPSPQYITEGGLPTLSRRLKNGEAIAKNISGLNCVTEADLLLRRNRVIANGNHRGIISRIKSWFSELLK